jgi:flagellar hook assembly protein FlgD
VAEPYRVELAVYNEAGERVRVLYQGTASTAGPSLTAVSQALADGSTQVSISGFTSGATGNAVLWSGQNDQGQPVSNGSYYTKLSVVDAFGTQQSYTAGFNVMSTADTASVEIFNSAGERVRTIQLPANLLPVDMRALEDSFLGGLDSSGQPLGGLRLRLKDSSGEQPLLWDGLNDQGQVLASGSYTVQLTRTQAGGARVVKSLSVILLASPDEALQLSLASATVAPNPVHGAGVPVSVFYKLPPRGTAVCRLYDLAGQLVDQGADTGGGGVVTMNAAFAGGVYVMEFRLMDGSAILGRRILKLAVVR